MLNKMRHAVVIYGVMMSLMIGMIVWSIYWDTLHPNPGLMAQAPSKAGYTINVRDQNGEVKPRLLPLPVLPELPVDQKLGNLEGKELRFGTSAGATYAACTTAATCGSVNCMHDSLNPLAILSPFTGMWLNCVFGGKGVGIINLLVYLIVGVFLAGLMVGRTPEYLGKKVEGREMKLAMLALLIHPIMILCRRGCSRPCPGESRPRTTQDRTASARCCTSSRPRRRTMGPAWKDCRTPGGSIIPRTTLAPRLPSARTGTSPRDWSC